MPLPPDSSLQPQDRDFALLAGLFHCRVMTATHVAALYFEGKKEATKKRLQKLKAAGLIGERKRHVNEPSILFLTRKGFDFLNSHGKLSEYPQLSKSAFESRVNVSELRLQHELEVMDFKSALHTALTNSDVFSISEFSSWPMLYEFKACRPKDGLETSVQPDGFIRIHEKEAGTKGYAFDCFLELDRSTEALDTLVAKAECYRDFYSSGGFAVRNGSVATEFRAFPFRVLMIMKTNERRNNAAERLAQNNPPVLTSVWLTTFTEATSDPLGAIWIRPVEYRNLLIDSQHYSEKPKRKFEYRRRPEREAFVEANILKRRLLEGDAVTESAGTSPGIAQNPDPGSV